MCGRGLPAAKTKGPGARLPLARGVPGHPRIVAVDLGDDFAGSPESLLLSRVFPGGVGHRFVSFRVAGKVAAGIRRKIGGGAVVLTEYAGPGEVGFAGEHPGTIRAVELGHGEEIVVRRRGFLAASPSVDLSVAMVTRLRAGVLAGHTLVLQRLSGPGTVFVHAAGDFAGFTLGPGEVLRADTAALVWFDASVDYSAAWAGTVKRALLGGEGLFLSTFTGPGRVTLQTMGRAPAGGRRQAGQGRGRGELEHGSSAWRQSWWAPASGPPPVPRTKGLRLNPSTPPAERQTTDWREISATRNCRDRRR